jgi:hypothetical protein
MTVIAFIKLIFTSFSRFFYFSSNSAITVKVAVQPEKVTKILWEGKVKLGKTNLFYPEKPGPSPNRGIFDGPRHRSR